MLHSPVKRYRITGVGTAGNTLSPRNSFVHFPTREIDGKMLTLPGSGQPTG